MKIPRMHVDLPSLIKSLQWLRENGGSEVTMPISVAMELATFALEVVQQAEPEKGE